MKEKKRKKKRKKEWISGAVTSEDDVKALSPPPRRMSWFTHISIVLAFVAGDSNGGVGKGCYYLEATPCCSLYWALGEGSTSKIWMNVAYGVRLSNLFNAVELHATSLSVFSGQQHSLKRLAVLRSSTTYAYSSSGGRAGAGGAGVSTMHVHADYMSPCTPYNPITSTSLQPYKSPKFLDRLLL